MDAYNSFLSLLDEAITRAGNINRLAQLLSIQPNVIYRWHNRTRVPSLDTFQPILDYLGMEVRFASTGEAESTPAGGDDLRLVVKELRAQLATTERERDVATGQVSALKEQLALAMEMLVKK